jgi:hypothetical protein
LWAIEFPVRHQTWRLTGFNVARAMLNRSLISRGLETCSVSQPNLSQCYKLIVVLDQKYFGPLINTGMKVLAFRKFTTELGSGINGRVELSHGGFLGLGKG